MAQRAINLRRERAKRQKIYGAADERMPLIGYPMDLDNQENQKAMGLEDSNSEAESENGSSSDSSKINNPTDNPNRIIQDKQKLNWRLLENIEKSPKSYLRHIQNSHSTDFFPGLESRFSGSTGLKAKFDIRESDGENDSTKERKGKRSRASSGDGSSKRNSSIVDLGIKVKNLSKSAKMAAEDELRYEALRFAHSTTAHGIPMAMSATQWYAKGLWLLLSLFSLGIFIYQCVLVFDKFQRKDKIVNVELQFENAAFPAVTICRFILTLKKFFSLNPFKQHLARKVPEVSETLDAYHQAVTYSKDANQYFDTVTTRDRRNVNSNPDCECEKAFPGRKPRTDCVQKDTIPKSNESLCFCNYDRQDSTVWPCYHAEFV